MKVNKIYQGDASIVLKTFPDESMDCCIASPPYWGLRDYGTGQWEGGDPKCDHTVAKLKSRYDYDLSKAQTGTHSGAKEGTDQAKWKDKCPTCGAVKKDLQLGLEPTFQEYINKLCDIYDEIKRVLKKTGTCWVNMGDTYWGGGQAQGHTEKTTNAGGFTLERGNITEPKARGEGYQDKSLCQIPQRFSIEMTNRGWILRNVIIWFKRNCMPSSIKDRFTVDFEYVFFFVKQGKYWFEQQFEPHLTQENRPDGIVRNREYGYDSKLNAMNKKEYTLREKRGGDKNPDYYNPQGRNKRCVWDVCPQPFSKAHFAVYPEKLIEPMILAGCPKKGIVLDPFMGSGTTGVVAKKNNRDYIGIELNPEYIEMAEARIQNTQRTLF